MKKGVLLSIFAILLVGMTIYGIWYVNEQGKIEGRDRNSFIPYNSALVISVNEHVVLSPEMKEIFAEDIRKFQAMMLSKVVDTLMVQEFIDRASKVLAIRMEGKNDVAFLYVIDNKAILSRGEVVEFLGQVWENGCTTERKYDRHKIYSLEKGNEKIFYSIDDGMILISDSELYIEDGLKQFDQEMSGKQVKSKFQNIDKYFSAGTGINIFLNTNCFANLLPLFLDVPKISEYWDITKCFKWGAMDGEWDEDGLCLNGFLDYTGQNVSFMSVLKGQQPREGHIDEVIPAHSASFMMLNLSDLDVYFAALEQYCYNARLKDQVMKRKEDFAEILGSEYVLELRELLQGEFARVNFSFNKDKMEHEGVIMVQLKSSGMGDVLIDRMLSHYGKINREDRTTYQKIYNANGSDVLKYYRFPVEDFASISWGYFFDGIKNRYVMVVDNYLVFASSEESMKKFIKDYTYRNFVKDVDWYKHMQTKLSRKYNLSYFAEVAKVLPFYEYIAKGDWKDYLMSHMERLSFFSTIGVQWSNESDMLYNTFLVSTDKLADQQQARVLWQTKLEHRMSMKPVIVKNHVTGEREFFVQDDNDVIYLISDAGRIIWKQLVDGPINSEVYQVDAFKNGKLQYLFSTSSKMYLIDRNGKPVGKFPVAFSAECHTGITMYDYEKDRNYRIFAPCVNRCVYLYDLKGNQVKGWACDKADKEIVSRVYYYRVKDKDYIVYADCNRLYILDRRGKVRVNVASVFNLKNNTDIYLTRYRDEVVLVFTNGESPINIVNFKGNVQTMKCGNLLSGCHLNVADITGDDIDEYIFTDTGRLFVYNLSGQLLYEKEFDGQRFGFPDVYRFSDSNIYIGLFDQEQKHIVLLNSIGEVVNGFPIPGDSSFSMFSSKDNSFFLLTGADDVFLIKYGVSMDI